MLFVKVYHTVFKCLVRNQWLSRIPDPGWLSRIPDPDFYPSRIPDLGNKNSNKREGRKKICCHTLGSGIRKKTYPESGSATLSATLQPHPLIPFINLHNIPKINQANSLQNSKPQFFILSIKNKEYEQKEKFFKSRKKTILGTSPFSWVRYSILSKSRQFWEEKK